LRAPTVTAGDGRAYVLGKVTPESASLVVFRDFTYPLGVGSFDQYPIPLRAFIVKTERRGERLESRPTWKTSRNSRARIRSCASRSGRSRPAKKFRETATVHSACWGRTTRSAAPGLARVQNGRLVVDLAGRLKPGAYGCCCAGAQRQSREPGVVKVLAYRVGD